VSGESRHEIGVALLSIGREFAQFIKSKVHNAVAVIHQVKEGSTV
jgi:hypothetical protein